MASTTQGSSSRPGPCPPSAAERKAPVNTLERWTEAACAELGIDPSSADMKAVLDLARDVAHGVARPAAPWTAYLLGVAVGRGRPMPEAAGRLPAPADRWRGAGGGGRRRPGGGSLLTGGQKRPSPATDVRFTAGWPRRPADPPIHRLDAWPSSLALAPGGLRSLP